MNVMASTLIALEAIRANKMRSFLTMLGIIIGVASVITMVSIGAGARQRVEEQINSLGSNMLMLFPGSRRTGGRRFGAGSAKPFTEDDVAALKEDIPAVIAASGTLSTGGQVVNGNVNWATSIRGVQEDYLFVADWGLVAGRNFSARELRSAAKVALLGQTTATELFGASDPVGQTIRVKNVPFRIIGLLRAKGRTSFGSDQDDTVIVPIATARNRLGGRSSAVAKAVRDVRVKIATDVDMAAATIAIEELLRTRRRIAPGADADFSVRNITELLSARNETQNIFALLLGAAASISLLVGGIGIMNIMLVSVTERTREIGLRLAVGARTRDVLSQFLVEAVTLSMIGGIIGIILGVSASFGIARFAGWPTLLGVDTIVLAAVFSAVVGIGFGFYPARKASLLNPIDALRFE